MEKREPGRQARPLPELLLPAGSFESGLAAFEGGADAVYLGLEDFSARRQARNFDRLEYRRLLAEARRRGGRVYAAINTLILESELPRVAELLSFLSAFPPDAVIVQDWGLASLIREGFPELCLHASTQTALQGPEAARLAALLGVRRIVLPRETSPLELALLAEALPGMEFEVFVQGALCYSYSGLCLASGLLLKRSGNRGDCAQVCRSYYEARGPGLQGRGHWFSCRDLSLEGRLGELWEAGAASLKVEGRMKAPEYVYAAARLYRGALEALQGRGPGEAELGRRREALRIAFSRAPTEAYARHHAGSELLDPAYPGHRGLRVGTLLEARAARPGNGPELLLSLEGPLGLRDGLLAFAPGRPGRPLEALQYPVLELREAGSGRSLVRAEAGSRVLASLGPRPGEGSLPEAGSPLFRISARDQDLRRPSPEEYPPALLELPARLGIEATGGEGRGRLLLELELPRSLGGREEVLRLLDTEPLEFQAGRQAGGFLRALGLFSERGEADFLLLPRLEPEASLTLPGEGQLGLADLFLPPSQLKKAKNRLYEAAAGLLESRRLASAARAAALDPGFPARAPGPIEALPAPPPRAALVFPHPDLPSGLPFATPRLLREGSSLPSWGGLSWLPLAPLVARREAYAELALRRLREELSGGARLAVGLGALHHFALTGKMLEAAHELGAESRLGFFGDVHLYVANRLSLGLYSRLLPELAFAYHYLEAGEEEASCLEAALGGFEARPALARVGEGFEPPLFLSSACLLRHHGGKGSCPSPCPRRWSLRLEDRERSYLALTEDCVSMLFLLGEGRRA